jgi:hypothetical protein
MLRYAGVVGSSPKKYVDFRNTSNNLPDTSGKKPSVDGRFFSIPPYIKAATASPTKNSLFRVVYRPFRPFGIVLIFATAFALIKQNFITAPNVFGSKKVELR